MNAIDDIIMNAAKEDMKKAYAEGYKAGQILMKERFMKGIRAQGAFHSLRFYELMEDMPIEEVKDE